MSSAAALPRRRSLRRLFPPRPPPPAEPRRSFLAKPSSRRQRRRDRVTPPPPKPPPPLDAAASSVSDVSTQSAPATRLHFLPVGEDDVPDAAPLPPVPTPHVLRLMHEELAALRRAHADATHRLATQDALLADLRARLADSDAARTAAVDARHAALRRLAQLEDHVAALRRSAAAHMRAPDPRKRASLPDADADATRGAFARVRSAGNVHERRRRGDRLERPISPALSAPLRAGVGMGRGTVMRRSLLRRSFVAHIHSKKYRGARAAWSGFLKGEDGVTPEMFARAVRALAIAQDAKDRDLEALREEVAGAEVGDTGVVTWEMFEAFYRRTRYDST